MAACNEVQSMDPPGCRSSQAATCVLPPERRPMLGCEFIIKLQKKLDKVEFVC